MNERIKELIAQAAKWVCENEPRSMDDDELFRGLHMEKFAELIVRECINSVMDGTQEGDDYAMRIEKHFGIEK